MSPPDAETRERTVGLAYGLSAFLAWGISPVFFKALAHVPPVEIATHRVIWSMLLLGVWLRVTGRLGALFSGPRSWRRVGVYAITTTLIGGNWVLFIWAVNSGRILEASLGYFINPLVNVVLGVVFLKETLNGRQRVAVLLALAAVAYQVIGYGRVPLVSLTLALSFGAYGLLRKRMKIEPVGGLFIETALMAPLALAYVGHLGARGEGAIPADGLGTALLLIVSGAVTALPLIWFIHGARRLRLSTVGILQYLAPSMQFLLAVLVYGEVFTPRHAVTFALIWASLAVYTVDALWNSRRRPPTGTPVEA